MSTIYPALPKLSLRDSGDDEDLTDIDDEVFIRDGKSSNSKLDNDGVKRPLMAPRKKCRKEYNWETKKFPCKALLLPICCGFSALIALIGLIALCIFTANMFPMPLTILKSWLSHELKNDKNETKIIPCTSLATSIVWIKSLPKLMSEAPLRSNDVNGDNIEDLIIGFGTGLDTMDASEYFCTMYFGGQIPCAGGVLALDGKTGDTIWTHWTNHAIFSVHCESDLTSDNIKDCIISGREGILRAINGHDGSIIWERSLPNLVPAEDEQLLNAYDAKFIHDHDGDNIADLIVSHVVQSEQIHRSRVLMVSGKNGNVIHGVTLPDTEQLLIAPQSIVQSDGEVIFVLATNSKTQAGGLYIASEYNLFHGELKLQKLRHSTGKGASLPPILVDITLDGITDIVAAMFNSTITAYDGVTFEPLWNYTIPNSEVISIPIPGYYNDDNVPDFMVKHQVGSGFPVYYYTTATIIDGRNGKPLLENPMEDSLSKHMSGLSLAVEGFGNDWFIHWSADCLNYEGVKEKYQFLKEQDMTTQMRADLCKLRFNSTLATRLLALSQHVAPPGIPLYFSEDWKSVEYNVSTDSRIDSNYFETRAGSELMDVPFVSERSLRFHKNHQKNSNFGHKENLGYMKLSEYPKLSDINEFEEDKPAKFETDNEDSEDNEDTEDTYVADNSWKNPDGWVDESNKNFDLYNRYSNNDEDNNEDTIQENDYSQQIREQRSEENNISENSHKKILQTLENMYENINNDDINKKHVYNVSNKTQVLKNQINEIDRKDEKGNIPSPTMIPFTQYFESNLNKNESYNNTNKTTEKRLLSAPYNEKMKNYRRKKRVKRKIHTRNAVPNIVEGIQRQPPTGILLPSITQTNGKTSVDLIFATFWLPSSKIPVILLQEDLDCIHKKKALLDNKVRYKENDDFVRECLFERGINYKLYQEAMDRENVKMLFGQMTVYRMKIECVCPEDILINQTCKNISRYQNWPQYQGFGGNGFYATKQN